MITLRQIQFALAVSRHKHFKRAAEECNVSQSALSLGIAEMEKHLGVVIFERNNKQVVVTPIGQELLTRAQKIFLDAQQLVERAHAGNGELNYGMSIGFIPTIAPYLLPATLPLLREYHPNFDMNIHEDVSERLVSMVSNGLLDAAVLALPFDVEGLNVLEISHEIFYALVHENHKLSQFSKVTPKQLKDLPLLLSEGHCLRNHIVEVCELENDNSHHESFRHASLNTLVHMAVNNMGITLIPEMALPSIANYPSLKAIKLDKPGPHRRLVLVTRPNYPRENELKRLIQLFQNALNTLKHGR